MIHYLFGELADAFNPNRFLDLRALRGTADHGLGDHPRPPIPGEVLGYEVPPFRRLSLKSGLTYLLQGMPERNEVSFKTWAEKDMQYIDNWSLWLDLRILFRTFEVILGRRGC